MSKLRAVVKKVGGQPFKAGKKASLEGTAGKPGLVFDLVNDGDEAVEVDLEAASIASLCLEVRSPAGRRVHLPPPPVPRGRAVGWATLAPGEAREIQVAWVPPPWWSSGDYQVRYQYRGAPEDRVRPGKGRRAEKIVGDWVKFGQRQVKGAARAAKSPAAPPKPCSLVASREVDEPRSQTITDATNSAWNGTYSWRARFRLTVDQGAALATVQIRVRVIGTITSAQRAAWEAACQTKWSNLFKACCAGGAHDACCANGYTFVLDLKFVNNGQHYTVAAGSSTTNMTNWGAADTVDNTHELGHMLGNKDEYYTVDGIAYGEPRQPNGNIMNNPPNLPVVAHHDLILTNLLAILGSGTLGVTRSVSEACE